MLNLFLIFFFWTLATYKAAIMFSNRQQDNSSNLLHQTISTSGSIGLPPTPPIVSIAPIATNSNNNLTVTSVATTILAVSTICYTLVNLN